MAKRKTEILALFQESYDMTKDLPDQLFGQLMKAVCEYRFTGTLPEVEDPAVCMALRFVISQVDRYGDYCQQKREAAKERYSRQKEAAKEEPVQKEAQQAPKDCETPVTGEETQHKDTVQKEEGVQKAAEDPSISMSVSMSKSKSMSMSESMSISDKKKEREAASPRHTQFIPPTVEQVDAYCKKLGTGIDSRRFVDYYTSIGWVVGGCPIRDWTAVLRNWIEKEKKQNEKPDNTPQWIFGTYV